MSSYLKFWLLWMLTGSPVTAALIMLAVWALADWHSFGLLRRLFRFLYHAERGRRLAHEIAINPHQRKARAELGEILLEQHRYQTAMKMLKPLVEQDPDDLTGLFLMGIACFGAGHVEQGELLLQTVDQADPNFRQGAAVLEMGRCRLRAKDAKGAAQAFARYLAAHASSVEGHYLLSRALQAMGDISGARQAREHAWNEYVTSLPYQRRMNRAWAWRARPSRPVIWAALALTLILAASIVVRHVDSSVTDSSSSAAESDNE